jgi:hypothetical protein
MNQKIINHYLQFGLFTNPSLFKGKLASDLPDDIKKLGLLVRKQCIHRVTLRNGNTGTNKDIRYGDMTKVPWFRQCEDDNLPSASAMLAELYRRDMRGFVIDRAEKDRLVVTCRFVSILMASILKSKGISTRVRSGFAPYFELGADIKGKSVDHWINQYWSKEQNKWITIDVDGSLEGYHKFNPYDMPEGTFDFSADAWLNVRASKIKGEHFWNAGGFDGLVVVAWELFYDFHSLMNSEIIYLHAPEIVKLANFPKLTEDQLKEIDELAKLMQAPDDNFDKLKELWETKREFRLLIGALL